MMKKYHIVMGDIIKSGAYPALEVQKSFQEIISNCNDVFKTSILSPYTITLGDEFQGIINSLKSAVEAILYLEEVKLQFKVDFKLRYVIHYGEIETAINDRIAYGMIGRGLTRARELLSEKRWNQPRFKFDLPDELLSLQLSRLFSILAAITQRWNLKDFPLIKDMILNDSNTEVGVKYGKTRGQIWKRKKTLLIREYNTLKSVISDMIVQE